MTITVFSRPARECVACRATEISFRRKEIEVQKVPIDENIDYVKSLGYSQAPVVVVEQDGQVIDHWSDFREEKIAALKGVK